MYHAEDDFTYQLDREVRQARLNEEWRAEDMKTYVNDMDMRREGYEEGEKRGISETEKRLLQNLIQAEKIPEEKAKEMLGIK